MKVWLVHNIYFFISVKQLKLTCVVWIGRRVLFRRPVLRVDCVGTQLIHLLTHSLPSSLTQWRHRARMRYNTPNTKREVKNVSVNFTVKRRLKSNCVYTVGTIYMYSLSFFHCTKWRRGALVGQPDSPD